MSGNGDNEETVVIEVVRSSQIENWIIPYLTLDLTLIRQNCADPDQVDTVCPVPVVKMAMTLPS